MAETVTNETAVPLLPVLANALPDNKLIPLDKFDDAAHKRIAEIAAMVSIADSNSVMTFGAEPQRRMKRPAPDTPPGK